MKKLLTLICVLAMSTPAVAAVHYFNAGAGTADWNTPANWSTGYVPFIEAGHAHVIPNGPSNPNPIVSSAVPDITYLTPGWHASSNHIGINPSGSLTVTTGHISLGSLAGTTQTVSIKGGTLTANGVYWSAINPLATDGNGDQLHDGKAFTHVNAGGTLSMGNIGLWGGSAADPQWHTGDNTNIDIELGGTVLIGRQLGAGELDWWNTIGVMTALDGTGIVQESWNGSVTTLTASDPYTTIWSADFEDGEVNPGYLPAGTFPGTSINTEAYPATQPASFADSASAVPQTPPTTATDGYGWTNRGSGYVDGQTIIVDTESYSGENSASVENRTLRTDIPLTLAEGQYRFTFWYMVPEGQDLSFGNKIVMKDQTNGFMFYTENNIIDAPAHDVWFSRTFGIDTVGYAPAIAGDTIQFRFGAWFNDDHTDIVYTDNWSLSFIPEPTSVVLLGLGGLALIPWLRRRR